MNDPAQALMEYRRLRETLEALERSHPGLFAQHAELTGATGDAENVLKLALRESPLDVIEDERFVVTKTEKTRRYYNVDLLISLYPQVRDMPGVVKVVETVDKKLVEKLIKLEQIPPATADLALVEEPMTASVSIRERL